MSKRPRNQIPFAGRCNGASGYQDADVRAALDELTRINKKTKADDKTSAIKKAYTEIRRKEFNSKRNRIVLAMLADGRRYVCATDGCEINDNLHVDHVVPLSKGGSDEIYNLQFLCREHNSSKGTKKK